jgi:lipid-binding SYLF domain-containing protein
MPLCPSARSALKPNLAQLDIVLAHALIAGFARPLEAFFRQFPIVSGRRHRFVPAPGTKEGAWGAPSFYELSSQGFGGWESHSARTTEDDTVTCNKHN